MSKKPLTRAELKRLEQLQKQIELKESKLNTREAKLKKAQKDLESGQRQLATEKKQFSNEKKQFKQDKLVAEKNAKNLNATPKGDRPFSAQKSRKLKEDYAALKKKHEHFAKLMRDYKKKADQLDAENAVLRRRVQNANNKKLPTNDKQLRGLMKENTWLKKKLRELMKELRKNKRWYNKVVKVFKDNNNKWVQKKIEAYKDKQYIIKYVFLDDIKRITLTRPGHERNGFKPRIRIKNGKGGSIVLRNVGIDVFDQKVRKRDNKGKRDRRGGTGGKGRRNSRDIITKQRAGKDGKNIIKTKYVDKGDIDTITKEKAGKKGDKKGGKNSNVNSPTPNKNGKGGKGGKGGSSPNPDNDDDNNDDSDDKNKKGKHKKKGSKTDAATSAFLEAEASSPANSNGTGNDNNGGDDDNSNNNDNNNGGDGDDIEIDEDEWETLDDPDDLLDEYMMEFLKDLGIAGVTKDNLDSKMDEAGGGGAGAGSGSGSEDDDDEEDAKLDKEFQHALKSDKDLVFDGDSNGSPELQAQIMYLMGEMDSRNEDLNKLQQIANGVQYLSKPDATGSEEDMEEKQLDTLKDKMDAMDLVFASMKERQEKFLSSLDELNCDTDALRPINDTWYDQYQMIAKMALTGGGGNDKAKKNFEKLRYFIDYFMKELVGRMYDLRCVNAAYYNQDINFDENGAIKETTEDDDDDDNKKDDRAVFDVLQSGLDDRHNELHDTVSKDEVMNGDNTEDEVSANIESVLNEFLGNIDDWKSLIQETRTKHETWIDTRGKLINAMSVRHNEIGELMDKINNVPSYTMNLQKYAPKEIENDNDNETETETANNSANDDDDQE